MAKKIKIIVNCDRCDKEATLIKENKSKPRFYFETDSRHDTTPDNWGDLKATSLKSLIKSREAIICDDCIQSLKKWIEQK